MAAPDESLRLHALFLAVLNKREDAQTTITACNKVIDDVLDARNQLNQETP